MKNLFKTGLLALVISIFISACGDKAKTATGVKIDSDKTVIDTSKKAAIDTTKKDTMKK